MIFFKYLKYIVVYLAVSFILSLLLAAISILFSEGAEYWLKVRNFWPTILIIILFIEALNGHSNKSENK